MSNSLLEVHGEQRLGQMTLCLIVYLYTVMVVMTGSLRIYFFSWIDGLFAEMKWYFQESHPDSPSILSEDDLRIAVMLLVQDKMKVSHRNFVSPMQKSKASGIYRLGLHSLNSSC